MAATRTTDAAVLAICRPRRNRPGRGWLRSERPLPLSGSWADVPLGCAPMARPPMDAVSRLFTRGRAVMMGARTSHQAEIATADASPARHLHPSRRPPPAAWSGRGVGSRASSGLRLGGGCLRPLLPWRISQTRLIWTCVRRLARISGDSPARPRAYTHLTPEFRPCCRLGAERELDRCRWRAKRAAGQRPTYWGWRCEREFLCCQSAEDRPFRRPDDGEPLL